MEPAEVLERLVAGADEALAGQPVLFAYLFGSHARGGPTSAWSDVDVAVYIEDDVPADRRFDLRLTIPRLLERASGVGGIEVVVLNDAPLPLAGRVLRDRVVLYSRDEPRRVRYESKLARMFHDFQIHDEPAAWERLRAIAEGRR